MRTRYRWCNICGGSLHDVSRWPDNCREEEPQRSELAAPNIILDTLPGGVNGLYHHAALRKTDSKSEFRRLTKEAGCQEVGNERPDMKPREDIGWGKDVAESAVNESLHRMGISSESDLKDANYVVA